MSDPFEIANRVAAEVFRYDPVRHRFNEDESAEFHGVVQDVVIETMNRMSGIPERLFREWARTRISLGGTIGDWAEERGYSLAFVSAVLRGKSTPSPRFLADLGASWRAVYTIPDDPKSIACLQTAGFALLERDRRELRQ